MKVRQRGAAAQEVHPPRGGASPRRERKEVGVNGRPHAGAEIVLLHSRRGCRCCSGSLAPGIVNNNRWCNPWCNPGPHTFILREVAGRHGIGDHQPKDARQGDEVGRQPHGQAGGEVCRHCQEGPLQAREAQATSLQVLHCLVQRRSALAAPAVINSQFHRGWCSMSRCVYPPA